jgi:hypothetical protein
MRRRDGDARLIAAVSRSRQERAAPLADSFAINLNRGVAFSPQNPTAKCTCSFSVTKDLDRSVKAGHWSMKTGADRLEAGATAGFAEPRKDRRAVDANARRTRDIVSKAHRLGPLKHENMRRPLKNFHDPSW